MVSQAILNLNVWAPDCISSTQSFMACPHIQKILSPHFIVGLFAKGIHKISHLLWFQEKELQYGIRMKVSDEQQLGFQGIEFPGVHLRKNQVLIKFVPRRKPSYFVSFKNTLRKPPTKKNVSPLAFSLKCEVYHSFLKSANYHGTLFVIPFFPFQVNPRCMRRILHYILILTSKNPKACANHFPITFYICRFFIHLEMFLEFMSCLVSQEGFI